MQYLFAHDNLSVAVIYSDAYYNPSTSTTPASNGWGFVAKVEDHVFFAHGAVPDYILSLYCQSKAYIYFLEMVAHVIPILLLRHLLPHLVVAYVDNQAGMQALGKGYGKDPRVNSFISFVTKVLADLHVLVHYEWVPSNQNISDPISRKDFQLAIQHQWERVRSPLDPLWHTLQKVADNLPYALGLAAQDCLRGLLPLRHSSASCESGKQQAARGRKGIWQRKAQTQPDDCPRGKESEPTECERVKNMSLSYRLRNAFAVDIN